MNLEEEKQLRKQLQTLSKDRVIDLFIKMKKAYLKTSEHLAVVENELIEKTSLEDLINEIPDDVDNNIPDDYEHCPYYIQEETNESTVFDHPNYVCYCTKSGKKQQLTLPSNQCNRCIDKQKENLK